MANNSTRHPTWEYPLLKTCVVLLSALLKIKSTSPQKGIFSLLAGPGKLKLPEGKEHSNMCLNPTPKGLLFLLNRVTFH